MGFGNEIDWEYFIDYGLFLLLVVLREVVNGWWCDERL